MAAIRQRGGMTITLTPDECRQNLLAEAVLRLVDVDYSVGLQEIITLLKSVY